MANLDLDKLVTDTARNSMQYTVREVAKQVNDVNTKMLNLSDPVTITIDTLTVGAINTALASIRTQQVTTIAALKA